MNRVLVIEDDRATRQQVVRLLRLENFEVHEAENGSAGLDAAAAVRPDAIVCDIMMPSLDGFGVLEAVRARPETALTPFIFLTAKTDARDLRQGMRHGADDYIAKPFTADELLASLRLRLARRALQIDENRRASEQTGWAAAAVVPQELLAPLDHIETVVGLLALGGQDGAAMYDSVRAGLARVRRALRRLDLYSKLPALYARRFEMQDSAVVRDAGALIQQEASIVALELGRAGDLRFELSEAPIAAAHDHLAIMTQELVSNACKFSPAGTLIEVAFGRERAFTSLIVRDHGPGMVPEMMREIGVFRQFRTGGRRPDGLGLGLALVQGLARLYGGELALESSSESGARVSVLLPRESPND